jgi:hypothetical protein
MTIVYPKKKLDDDWDEVPEDIQERMKKIAEEKFIPAVKEFISVKLKRSFDHVGFHEIPFSSSLLAGFFNREERYYLCELAFMGFLPN